MLTSTMHDHLDVPRALLLLIFLGWPGCHRLLPFKGGQGDLAAEGPRADGSGERADIASGDAARTDQAAPALCGGPELLTDDFEDGVRGPQWDRSWSDPAVLSTEAGRLVFTLSPGLTGEHYSAYASSYIYNLVGGRVYVEVPVVPDASADAILSLAVPGGGSVSTTCQPYFDAKQSKLIKRLLFQYETPSSGGSLRGETLYEPSAHRWWQIRESAGQILWETAPDGQTWTTHAQIQSPFDVSAIHVQLMAGTFAATANPGQVAFDNLNGGGPPSGQFCPSTSLTDDFETPERAREWGRTWNDPGCSLAEVGGELVGKPPTLSQGSCAYESWTAYRLKGSSVTVEVRQIVNAYSVASLQIHDEKRNQLLIEGSAETLHFYRQLQGSSKADVEAAITWDLNTCRWWRLREEGGTCHWETSGDGKSWRSRASELCPIDAAGVVIKLGTGTWVQGENRGQVHFDNLNLPPP